MGIKSWIRIKVLWTGYTTQGITGLYKYPLSLHLHSLLQCHCPFMKTGLLEQTVVWFPPRPISAQTPTVCSMIKISSDINNPQLGKTPQNKGLVIQDCPHYRHQVPKVSSVYPHFSASANLRFPWSFFKFDVLLEWLLALRKMLPLTVTGLLEKMEVRRAKLDKNSHTFSGYAAFHVFTNPEVFWIFFYRVFVTQHQVPLPSLEVKGRAANSYLLITCLVFLVTSPRPEAI